jgi:predicted DNA-binding transcriptional regulator AlpA
MTNEFLTTKEVANRYNLSVGTLIFWRHQTKQGTPKGPRWTNLEGAIRYKESDLKEWQEKHNSG